MNLSNSSGVAMDKPSVLRLWYRCIPTRPLVKTTKNSLSATRQNNESFCGLAVAAGFELFDFIIYLLVVERISYRFLPLQFSIFFQGPFSDNKTNVLSR